MRLSHLELTRLPVHADVAGNRRRPTDLSIATLLSLCWTTLKRLLVYPVCCRLRSVCANASSASPDRHDLVLTIKKSTHRQIASLIL